MPPLESKKLYLPDRDRAYWQADDSQDLALLYLAWGCRDFQRKPIPVSCHEGVVCVLIEEGCPTLNVAGKDLRMPTGTFGLIGPNCPFGWRQANAGQCRFLLWMWRDFHSEKLREISNSGYVVRKLNRKEREPLMLLHSLCRSEVLRPESPDAGLIEGSRMIFETTLNRVIHSGVESAKLKPDLIGQVQSWMRTHLDSKEPISRLCDYLGISQSTLHRMFTAELGMSPAACFHQIRMRKADELLIGSHVSIKEIAFQLGYEHFNDFSRAYRKHNGQCPSATRKKADTSTISQQP